MILIIDNYDSFTFNLVQYLQQLGEEIVVYRNDETTISQIRERKPKSILISPGPGNPNDAGVSLDVVKNFAGEIPILGVCLGHQTIVQAFGGCVNEARKPVHGKTSLIYHDGKGMFTSLPSPFRVARYHSLIAEKNSLPDVLEVSAKTEEGEIMAIRHKKLPIEGVQFHPEAILTEYGHSLLQNFIQQR